MIRDALWRPACDANDINFARWWSNAMRHTPTIWVNNFMLLICSIISATCRQSPWWAITARTHTENSDQNSSMRKWKMIDFHPISIDECGVTVDRCEFAMSWMRSRCAISMFHARLAGQIVRYAAIKTAASTATAPWTNSIFLLT